MKSTLSDLWRGDLHPNAEKTENDGKTKNLFEIMDKNYNILWNKLDTDGKQVLIELRECQDKLSNLKTEDAFAKGFSLAVKMMTEALAK